MAGLFDYEDPESVGRVAFSAGLLNASGPQRMPVSFGQALAQALTARQQAASGAGQDVRRNRLADAQIQKMQADTEFRRYMASKGVSPDMPAAIQVFEYIDKLPPEKKREFYASQRSVPTQTINGVLHEYHGPQIGWVPQTTLQAEGDSQRYLSAMKQSGQEHERAKYDLGTVWDPQRGRYVDATRDFRLGGVSPPMLPQGAPRLNQGPAGFPSVPPQVQQQRDSERVKILRQELASEPDPQRRAEIQREIDNTRGGTAYATPPGGQPAAPPVSQPRFEPKEQAELDTKSKSRISSYENSIASAKSAIKALEGSDKDIDIWSAGLIGGSTSWIPGVPGYDLKAKLLPVGAVNALEELKKMRFESPTGAAVGNVALGELEIFMNKWGSLDTKQSPSQLKKSVKEVKEHLDSALLMYKKAKEAEESYIQGAAPSSTGSQESEIEKLRKKHGLK